VGVRACVRTVVQAGVKHKLFIASVWKLISDYKLSLVKSINVYVNYVSNSNVIHMSLL